MNEYKFELEETWTLARELAWDVYSVTNRDTLNDERRLRDSVRRASFAIMANVAEGVERGGTLEFMRYLTKAKDEIEELNKQLLTLHARGFINSATLARLEMKLESLGCLISGLMTSINREFVNIDSVSVSYQGF